MQLRLLFCAVWNALTKEHDKALSINHIHLYQDIIFLQCPKPATADRQNKELLMLGNNKKSILSE